MDHRNKAAKALRVEGIKLVAAKKAHLIVPIVHHLDQLDALIL